jgi:hypothetical protein
MRVSKYRSPEAPLSLVTRARAIIRSGWASQQIGCRQTKALAIACGVSKLRSRHGESRVAARTVILKPVGCTNSARPKGP